ncbi:MAG TPA: VWA domain-containing protein [Candidatus Polarisedimenticolia bacterium]|nr:VWA domain-containing protein [Candidatus Polarisedimenticolia bacterium]
MGVRFDTPVWLVLLVPLLGLTFLLHLAARRRLGTTRRRIALALRTLVLVALVFALAGFQLVLPVDRLATIFVVDLSDSVGNSGRETALAFIRDSLEEMPEDDVAGIVAFGRDALVERLPEDLRTVDRIHSTPVKAATDIGAALRLASALFPDDAQKRIVLISDGNDTTGHGQEEAALAAARGVQVETVRIGLDDQDEVLIERLSTPSTARLGEDIEAVADVRSSVAQTATIRLYVDGTLVKTERVDLKEGQNRIKFLVKPSEPGFHTFRAVVEAARDTFSQNDRADSNTIVKGEPRILVLKGDEKVAAELVTALEAEGQTVDSIIPEALPTDFAGLATYDSIVVVDVPRLRLSDRQLAALQVYVRDLGRGLVMVGGPKSYGAGGYTDTPIEETLPVDMGVRDRQKQPDIALVVVIDKSGSMDACHCNTFQQGGGTGIGGVRKVDIGKEAILRAAAALTARDELGVVAFDSSAHWVVNTRPLGQISDLAGDVAKIQPNGQTNIFSGLDKAVESLEKTTATRRHIILLTDGWSSSGQYDAIIKRMQAAGITLSTVGAGGGSNPFLEGLAKQGGGRFYNAANPSSIPDIFLKETQQVSGQQIVEEDFFPIQTSSSPILRGIDEGFPSLHGYNGTTIKSAAQQVLVTARDDPLLAQWQYGLGRSVAWTSDSTGRWATNWVAWPGFSKFFSQLVGWTFPGEETGGIEATFEQDGNETRLHVESVEEDGSPRNFYSTTAMVVGPDLVSHPVTLDQVAPGVYETELGEIDSGAYAVRVTQTRPGDPALGRTIGLVAPVATEYRLLGANEAFLATLRSATGGRAIATAAEPWTHDLETTSSFTELWPWLLILALLLWPLDIALRRVSLGRRELVDARRWVGRTWRGWRGPAVRTAGDAAILATRERAGGAAARAALLGRESTAAPSAPVSAPTAERSGAATPESSPSVPPAPATPAATPGPAATPLTPAPTTPTPPPTADEDASDTISRLRDAKRRARGG